MSINANLRSPNKKELAEFLVSIANLIKASANKTVSINIDLDFDKG